MAEQGLPTSLSSIQVYKSLRTPLHNFKLPGDQLIWGAKNLVKCVGEIKTSNLQRKVTETSVHGCRRGAMVSAVKRRSHEKVKFSLSLRNEEIEYDFMILFKEKPPKGPKTSKEIQRQLDLLVPGLCLPDISLDAREI